MAELRTGFHEELNSIRASVTELGARVVDLIPRVTEVLLTQDLEGAQAVIEGDDEFDARSLDIEERALAILALQAPVAGDLREVASALKLSGDMERSADLCRNICRSARRIYGHRVDPALIEILAQLSDQARTEYAEALEAYRQRDATRAAALSDIDDYLDRLHHQFIEQILESHAREAIDLQVAVQLALVARFYERLGDHAVGLASKVTYIATGELPDPDLDARHRVREVGDPPPR